MIMIWKLQTNTELSEEWVIQSFNTSLWKTQIKMDFIMKEDHIKIFLISLIIIILINTDMS